MTVLAKTRIIHTKTEFNFIATAYRHTQYLFIPSVSSVECLLVYFSQGHFPNPPKSQLEQWHPWKVPIGSGDLGLLSLSMWPTIMSLATVWVSWLLMGCPKQWFLPPPTRPCPTSPHPTTHPTHPSIINTDGRKGWQKYHKIQPSEIEKVNYNKNQ